MSVLHARIGGRLADERGQSTVEFAAGLWVLIAAALIAWQLALVGWSANAAANAARTAARAYSRIGDAGAAADDGVRALANDGFGTKAVKVSFTGNEADVSLRMPVIVPWIQIPVTLSAHATMPHTG